MDPAIELEGIEKRYREGDESVVATQVSKLRIDRGEQVALVGRSGTGKTTLLNIISGILRPDAGTVRVCGKDVGAMSESARDRFRGAHIGMVYQTFNLLQPFTALENVLLGALFGGGSGGDDRANAAELLDKVGLGDRMHHRPNQLSVGQIQRVAICRALVNDPELVLMDEPLGNQDRETGGSVLDLLLGMAEKAGHTVVMVTHDPQSAERMQRTVVLEDLRMVSS